MFHEAGGSIVQENGGQQGAWGGESSGSLDEVFGPPDHLEAFESSEHFSGVILFFFEIASGRELTLRPRGVLGMPVDFTEAAFARAGSERCPISSSDDTQVVVKFHPGRHARTQAEVTVSPSLAVCVCCSVFSGQVNSGRYV